jgi:hypothetical protein
MYGLLPKELLKRIILDGYLGRFQMRNLENTFFEEKC